MRLVVTTEARLHRTPDGRMWTGGGPDHAFWTRYLSAFDQVRVVARVQERPQADPRAARVDGTAVTVWPLPHYLGGSGYARQLPRLRAALRAAAGPGDAVLLRVPSPIGGLLAGECQRRGQGFALEVVGDPYDVFAPGVVGHPLRPLLRHWSRRRLRQLCQRSVATAYVTAGVLQRRYPPGPRSVTASYSSVDLPARAFASAPRHYPAGSLAGRLISVGSLDQLYKGIDTLIDAIARLAAAGLRLHLVHIGDGRYRPELCRHAAAAGVADLVIFAGRLPAGAPIRAALDRADLFVHPSRTEGLPRALVEAMARGLPAVATTAGGIPELLDREYLVSPGDAAGLAAMLYRMATRPARLAVASAANLARARGYSAAALGARRDGFYRQVRELLQPSGRRRAAV